MTSPAQGADSADSAGRPRSRAGLALGVLLSLGAIAAVAVWFGAGPNVGPADEGASGATAPTDTADAAEGSLPSATDSSVEGEAAASEGSPETAPSAAASARSGEDDLVLIEAQDLLIRRAYAHPVAFDPSSAFDSLKQLVATRGVGRYRFHIEVRSRVETGGAHPRVFTTGLWLRIEDRTSKVRSPTTQIDFDGGPYERRVRVDAQGVRHLDPFERAISLDAAPYIAQVEELVRSRIE